MTEHDIFFYMHGCVDLIQFRWSFEYFTYEEIDSEPIGMVGKCVRREL